MNLEKKLMDIDPKGTSYFSRHTNIEDRDKIQREMAKKTFTLINKL